MNLQNVKLRHVEKKAAPSAAAPVICGDSNDYNRLMQETYLEEYLDVLHDVTFGTFTLSCPSAALQRAHEEKLFENAWKAIPELQDLSRRVSEGAKERGWKLVFVRLSSRSPKDAPLKLGKFSILLQKHYQNARVISPSDAENEVRNCKALALYAASTEGMQCENGDEAVELLVRSDRIQDDLKTTGEKLNVCVRQFQFFLPEFEVRAFVWQKRLTAITQYNQFVLSRRLSANRDAIEASCRKLAEDIITRIPLANFALDLVVTVEGDHADFDSEGKLQNGSFKTWVVEVNPLAEFTGFALFDWLKEGDRNVIMGKAPFEFRIADSVPKHWDIAPDYRHFLDTFPWEEPKK